jgi:hypothetical protein
MGDGVGGLKATRHIPKIPRQNLVCRASDKSGGENRWSGRRSKRLLKGLQEPGYACCTLGAPRLVSILKFPHVYIKIANRAQYTNHKEMYATLRYFLACLLRRGCTPVILSLLLGFWTPRSFFHGFVTIRDAPSLRQYLVRSCWLPFYCV